MDIGSRDGIYTLDALIRGASFVWAFDPNFDVCQSLRQNIHMNGWDDRCSVHSIGLWSKSCDMRYSKLKAQLEMEDDGNSVEVKTISLDEFMRNLSPSHLD